MNNKISNDYNNRLNTSLITKEVAKIVKADINQSQKITDSVNKNYVASKLLEDKQAIEAPLLRAPDDQKKSNDKIDLGSESKYKSKTFQEQEKKENKLTVSLKEEPHKEQKSNPHFDFLYLQLSYQNLIHQDILEKIKSTDKYDYYLGRLQDLLKGVNGLKDKYNDILNEVKKYKDAFIDYWMAISNEIKNNNLKTESEIINFLNNKNIDASLIKKFLSQKINNRSDMETFLKNNFSFMNIPDDISKCSLVDINGLHKKLSSFIDEAILFIPHITISKDQLNSISSHHKELDALINKEKDTNIINALASAKDQYKVLIGKQSKIELDVTSDTLSGMALLTFLLAKVRELTLKVMLERSENEQKLFEEMQDVTTKTLKDKIVDQKAQIKKQEEIQYWAGIGLKILAGLLTLVAGIAAIFTAGASLALIGVAVVMMVASVAITVADEVYQAIHGSSFMEEAMKPVAEAVGEAIDKIADFIITELNTTLDRLEKFGMPKDFIEKLKEAMKDKLKTAVKAIVTIALFVGAIALTFIAGPATNGITSIANKIFNEQVKQTLKRVLHEMLEAMLGKMIKQIIIEAMQSMLKMLNELLAKYATGEAFKTLSRTVIMSRFTLAGASNIINIYSETITEKIIKSVADSKKLEEILKLTQLLMDKLMESYHENVDTITDILKSMSEQSSVSNKAKVNIIRSISI